MRVSESEARKRTGRQLTDFFGLALPLKTAPEGVDFAFGTPHGRVLVEFKASPQVASVAAGIEQIHRWKTKKGDIPLLVVPYMGTTGAKLCEVEKIAWADLSGNAHIRRTGVFVHVEGKPNQFKSPGRPGSVFAPMASRVTRWLLAHPNDAFLQHEIAEATNLDDGSVSRIVRRLVADQLVSRDGRRVKPRDPALLLSAWSEAYDFSQHMIFRAHGVARSSEVLLANVANELGSAGIRHAATGLSGAWLRTRFAGFRLVTLYLELAPDDGLFGQLGLRPVERGENVWLVLPRDAGIFLPTTEIDGIRCVTDAQLILDLKSHPERSVEAAEAVRSRYLEESRAG